MRLSALSRGCVVLLPAFFGLGLATASAQDAAQFEAPALDAKALDTGVSNAAPKAKGKKAKAAAPAAPTAATKPGAKSAGGADRQFGELEGWSPGKEPPKPADKEHGSAPAKGAGVGMSPSGNMSVGLPF